MMDMKTTNTVQTQRLDREGKEKQNLKVMKLGNRSKLCCFVEDIENSM